MYKVIFDTNSVKNGESTTGFFGGRPDLEKFSKVADLIVPDMVVEEIKNHKRKHLFNKRDSFLCNPFHFLRNLNADETKGIDIEKVVNDLEINEKISFEKIYLSRSGTLEKIKLLSIRNLPPFSSDSDKGFKDAYIYFTALEYAENNPNEKIFFVTKDERLRDAFDGIKSIVVVKDFSEFEKHIDSYFRDEYFIGKLRETINETIVADYINGSWINSEGNWILKINTKGHEYFVEVDFYSREIIDWTSFDFSIFVDELVNSGAFKTTHSMIESLKKYVKYLSDSQIISMVGAMTSNSQLYLISDDEDVKEFFMNLYYSNKSKISEDIRWHFEQIFK